MKENTKIILIVIFITVLINICFFLIIKKDMNNNQNIINEKIKILNILDIDNTKNKESITELKRKDSLNSFAIYYGNDQLVTEAVIIKSLMCGENTCIIDIRPQPKSILLFKGAGNFDLSDRELRKMLIGIIDVFKKSYIDYFNKDLRENVGILDINGISITITANNYEVGTYKNGKIILKGEK